MPICSQTIYSWATWCSWRRTPSCQVVQISQHNLPFFPNKWVHGAKTNVSRGSGESKKKKTISLYLYVSSGVKWIIMMSGCHRKSPKPKLTPNHAHRILQGHESSPNFKLCAVACVLEVYLLLEEQLDNRWAATTVTLLAGFGVLAHIWRLFKYCRPGRSA